MKAPVGNEGRAAVAWRAVLAGCALTSIACLLLEFYGLLPMRTGIWCLFAPGAAGLMAFAAWGRARWPQLHRLVVIGAWAGLLATIAYDLYRVPFWAAGVPVFRPMTGFGVMLVGADAARLWIEGAGWLYHFSNGVTFGIAYALVFGLERWWRAVLFATGLELAMLVTPYPTAFGFRLTATFILVTLSAHLVYGVTLGAIGARQARMQEVTR